MSFQIGQQPCNIIDRQIESNAYAQWANVHECIFCYRIVSFCRNCAHDHHEFGWDTCLRIETASDKRVQRLIDELVDDLADSDKDNRY